MYREMADRVGFEPTREGNSLTVFKTVPINHSGTCPYSGINASRLSY